MTHVLNNCDKTRAYLEKLPKIYLIACWAGFEVREFPYAGKCDKYGIPYVWNYEDFDGTCDVYCLRKITFTTTEDIYGWSASKFGAEKLAEMANTANGWEWRNR